MSSRGVCQWDYGMSGGGTQGFKDVRGVMGQLNLWVWGEEVKGMIDRDIIKLTDKEEGKRRVLANKSEQKENQRWGR